MDIASPTDCKWFIMYWHPVKGIPTTWEKQYECFLEVHLSQSHTSLLLKTFLCIPASHACKAHLNTLITLNEMASECECEAQRDVESRKHGSVATLSHLLYAVNIMRCPRCHGVSLSMNWEILGKIELIAFGSFDLSPTLNWWFINYFVDRCNLTDSFSLSFHLI